MVRDEINDEYQTWNLSTRLAKQSTSHRVDKSKTKIDNSTVATGGSVSQEVRTNQIGSGKFFHAKFELFPPSLEMVETIAR